MILDNDDENLRGEISRIIQGLHADTEAASLTLIDNIHCLIRDEQSQLLRIIGQKMAGDTNLGGTAALFYLNRCANELDERPI